MKRFLSNNLLIILGVLSISCCIEIYRRAELGVAVGSIGAILGIFLSTVSARSADSLLDKTLVVLGLCVSFIPQYFALKLSGFL